MRYLGYYIYYIAIFYRARQVWPGQEPVWPAGNTGTSG